MKTKTNRLFILLILLIIANNLFSQSKVLDIPKDDFWYKYNEAKAGKINLPDLTDSIKSHYWRIWFNGQIVSYALDLIKVSENSYNAFITIYTQEVVTNQKEKPTDRIYYYHIPLSDSSARHIHTIIEETQINEVPSEQNIKGWGDIEGLDGITYTIENTTSAKYSFKSYWSPNYVKVDEAKKVNSFINTIESYINMSELITDFKKHIPFAAYNTGGPMVVMKIMTAEENRALKRERDRYRKENHM